MATEVKTPPLGLTVDQLLGIYRNMYLARRIDDKEIQLKRQNRIFFQINGVGHEAVLTAAALALRPAHDWVFGYYRDRALCLGLGVSPYEMFLGSFGAADDPASGGRQMPSHWGHRPLHIVTKSSCTGTQFNQAAGCAEASLYYQAEKAFEGRDDLRTTDDVTYVSCGDGTTSQGEFWESLNFACNRKLPVVYLVEDNGWAISTPREVNTAGSSISKLVRGFPDLFRIEVDGCDPIASLDAFRYAVQYARERKGPALVHAHVIRPYSHSLSDDESLYRPRGDREEEARRDPIATFPRWLVDEGFATPEQIDAIRAEVDELVNREADRAMEAPIPESGSHFRHVYSEEVDPTSSAFETAPTPPAENATPLTMVDAINACLKDEMGRDPRIVMFGEDVADATREETLAEVKGKGGVFKATAGCQRLHGGHRVMNSPLSESHIVGRAIGLAARGLKPVVEIQFFDYIWPAYMQIRNELATTRWRSNNAWSSPAVVRVAIGGYLTGGAMYHSQCGEVLFTHIPGLRVVFPSTAEDANGLLRTAIRSDDPVLFLEHKHLYRQTHNKGFYPGPDFMIPFGRAKVVQEGTDLTLVTYGATVIRSVQAARALAAEGISVEILDLRTLAPYDFEAIARSVKKTNRCLVVHEDTLSFGYGAEIAARVSKELFEYLDAPIGRVAATDTFVAYQPKLEDEILPQPEGIAAAIRETVRW